MLLYSRRVSFDNLYPTYIDPSNPLHSPPQFVDELTVPKQPAYKSKFSDLTFGFGGATINNIEEHYTQHQPTSSQRWRKLPKLPPPPAHSILKKTKNSSEYSYTISEDYQPRGELANFSDEEDEDEDAPTTPPLNAEPAVPASVKPRRKSFAGMSDEELIALENSYTTKSSLNIDSFNFKNEPSFLPPVGSTAPKVQSSPSTANSSTPLSPTSATSPEKPYPSRPVVEHGACCISAQHKDYDREFSQECGRVLLSCITGRKHTWNAIDYIFNDLAIDGDHVVITSHIPIREVEETTGQKTTKLLNRHNDTADDEDFEGSKNFNISSLLIYTKCQNIMKYLLAKLKKRGLKLKVSVEIINCETSADLIEDSVLLYKPHLVIIGSKTEDTYLQRSSTHSSISSNEFADHRPIYNRKNSSSLGKGYNGYYRVAGSKCMKLTSYVIHNSHVPVIVVNTNYYPHRIKFKSPFTKAEDEQQKIDSVIESSSDESEDSDDELLGDDPMRFKNSLLRISDSSRAKSINDINQLKQNHLKTERLLSSSAFSHNSSVEDGQEPRSFYPNDGPLPKVTFGDDLGFGNGQSMYKVKSLLDPVDNNLTISRTNTRSSSSSKKKVERSKSDSNVDADLGKKFTLTFKKFGFGKKK